MCADAKVNLQRILGAYAPPMAEEEGSSHKRRVDLVASVFGLLHEYGKIGAS